MSESRKILVVDAESRIRHLMRTHLENEGFLVEEAVNGKDTLKLALNKDYDLIVLDVLLSELDGFEVIERLRKEKTTPIIILTTKSDETDRVRGFEVGADDYVVKPFSPREVTLRVKAILRRLTEMNLAQNPVSNLVKLPYLTIDLDAYRVTANDQKVNLTPKEYDLLCFFAQAPNKVFKREDILREVWQYDFFGDIRTVDTHVKRLREKLKQVLDKDTKMIETVWGIGYKLVVEDETDEG